MSTDNSRVQVGGATDLALRRLLVAPRVSSPLRAGQCTDILEAVRSLSPHRRSTTPRRGRAFMGDGQVFSPVPAPPATAHAVTTHNSSAVDPEPRHELSQTHLIGLEAEAALLRGSRLVSPSHADWYRTRVSSFTARFRVYAPQLLLFPALFPQLSAATVITGPVGVATLLEMSAASFADFLATAVRERLIAPTLRELQLSGSPASAVIEKSILTPFKPLMKAFDFASASTALTVAWPLETTTDPSSSGEVEHEFAYIRGPAKLGTYPSVAAWSRQLLVSQSTHVSLRTMTLPPPVLTVDIFLVAKEVPHAKAS